MMVGGVCTSPEAYRQESAMTTSPKAVFNWAGNLNKRIDQTDDSQRVNVRPITNQNVCKSSSQFARLLAPQSPIATSTRC